MPDNTKSLATISFHLVMIMIALQCSMISAEILVLKSHSSSCQAPIEKFSFGAPLYPVILYGLFPRWM